MRQLRVGGHIAMYLLIFAVCVTGFMSSTYSGWSTTWWWLIELPYWGHEDEELNQLFSEMHLWACWGLLIAMAAPLVESLPLAAKLARAREALSEVRPSLVLSLERAIAILRR